MKKSLKLLSAALMALAMTVPALADTVTLYEGTDTCEFVPIYGGYYDYAGLVTQTIYPAADIAMMQGGMINSMKFYISTAGGNNLSGGTYTVSVGMTTQSQFNDWSPTPVTGLTPVKTASMTPGDSELLVEFDNPFMYTGDNLVVEFKVTQAGQWNTLHFYGIKATYNNAMHKMTYTESADAFHPKTTFDYTISDDIATVNKRNIDFGMVYLGNQASETITLRNAGKNAFTPVLGTLQAPFALQATPAELAPGESMDIVVNFVPATAGDYAQTLTIDCGVAGQFEVAINGKSAEQPAEIVVCQGDATHSSLPVFAYYYDMSNAKSQMIYTADMLTELKGKKISAVTFHPVQPLEIYDGVLQLSFGNVEQNVFTGYVALTGLDPVATMTPTKGDQLLTFVLDEPFEYTGGNLAIETLNIETGYYGQNSFYGVDLEEGYYSSYFRYGNGYSDVENFLPMVTFTYVKEDTPEPQGLRGDVDGNGEVAIRDVSALIDYLLSNDATGINLENANCNLDEEVSIGDVSKLIDYLLNNTWD